MPDVAPLPLAPLDPERIITTLARHGIAADRHYQLQQYGVKKRAHEDFDPVQAALVLEQVEADQAAQPLQRPVAVEASHG